ncbi:MAG: mucoidy inhibitor MuiA family protein [Flavobacteriales bacterium]|nr:mucoidy inhibitor MuiA family protein [Flavobacteriales bacterium]
MSRSPQPRSLLVLILLFHGARLLAIDDKPVTSTIKQVTVFLSGAQVERTGEVDLPKGTTRLVFGGLSAEVDPASVQVHGTGKFTLLSVKHGIAPVATAVSSTEVKALEAAITAIEREIQDEQTHIAVLQNEEQRLLKNESFEGGSGGISVERIRAINDYYRERITAVREGVVARQRHIAERTQAAQKLHLELEQLQGKKPRETSQVVVEVAATTAVHSTLTLRYVVRSAGWSPLYDVRVDDLSAPLALTYKAQVYQSTGEDWSEVRLELASGDPRVSGVMPQLDTWRLGPGTRPPGAVPVQRPTSNTTVSEVRGIVRDASTGEPLPFVNVALRTADGNALNGSATSFEGYYAMAVPPGARRIVFTYVGYQPHEQDLNSTTVNVELQQSLVELKELEVVQYKRPLIDRDAAAMTITSEQISNMPARSVHMRGARSATLDHTQGGVPANYGDLTGGVVNALPPVSTRHGNTHFSFRIALPYTIPSDGQGHAVAVKEHTIPSTYRHYCTPKLDPTAYLFAKLTGWDQLDLLPGPANLYFEGTFIGETYLDTEQVSDTMDISLGRDRSVVVQRKRLQDLAQRSFAGNKRTETIGWGISVRNTKGTPITLVITDQVPVPATTEVAVDLLHHDATALDTARGLLAWHHHHLPPSATAQHTFTYTVKAPKGMPLVLE